MAKRGTKPKNNIIKLNKGTGQPCRAYDQMFDGENDEDVIRPKWLKGDAKKIWEAKVLKFEKRGQPISGCEDTLAQYCALEADLIDQYKKKLLPPVAMINAYRIWANEFFDTPASQLVKSGNKKKTNPFLKHGR